MIGNLYLISNSINNKVYVGKTYEALDKRFSEHKRESKKQLTRPLYKAMNKHGADNFNIELIGTFIQGELEEYEQVAIAEFDSFTNGYNATLGGDGKRYLTITDAEIINTYTVLKNADATAKKLKISEDSVFKVLKANNIKSLFTNPGISVFFVEENTRFDRISDCARYLIENNYTNISSIPSLVYSIKRVMDKQRKAYKKLHFTY
jgi:hypothetical protein